MQFGVCVATKIDDWQLIQYAKELGYDRAWIPDSQMIWSDCYATLALAAQGHGTHGVQGLLRAGHGAPLASAPEPLRFSAEPT